MKVKAIVSHKRFFGSEPLIECIVEVDSIGHPRVVTMKALRTIDHDHNLLLKVFRATPAIVRKQAVEFVAMPKYQYSENLESGIESELSFL